MKTHPSTSAPATQPAVTYRHRWRSHLHLAAQMPWLAAKWLAQSRTLLERSSHIYDHLRRQPRHIRRRLQRKLGASLAGAALAIALTNAPVQAADFTANDAASLIAAINAANDEVANPGLDSITLTGNVTLTQANFTQYYGATGLPAINSKIKIEGAGFTIARDPHAPPFRLLTVIGDGDLTLNQVTLQGGYTTSWGGGIYTAGTVTINDSTLSGSTAWRGGGIFIRNGTVTVRNSTVTGNTAGNNGSSTAGHNGGGIYIRYYGTVTVSDSIISGNTANRGGGIYSDYGTVTVSNSTVTSNAANSDGGGMFSTGGAVLVSTSTLSGNSAASGGGGIFNADGTMTISNSTLSDNTAIDNGGGIFNVEGSMAVSNSTLSGNSATNGGGIYNDGTGTVSNSTFFGNIASSNGGGILNAEGTMTMVRTLLSGNSAINHGNEIYNRSPHGTINTDAFNLFGDSSQSTQAALVNVTLGAADRTATSNGTIPTPLAAILNPNLADNGGSTLTHALVSGSPAIDLAPAGPTIDQRGFTRPAGNGNDAGAMEYDASAGNPTPANARINGSDCNLIDAILAANTDTATGDCNAGVAGADIITLIDDVILTQPNVAAYYSGTGLPVIRSEITIEGAGFTIGRGAYEAPFRLLTVNGSGDLTLNQVNLQGGYASGFGNGGGIFNEDGTVTIQNSTITGNAANWGGGGIYSRGGTVTVHNSRISGNTASSRGGGIYNRSGSLMVSNSTLFSNTATYGGGISGVATVRDSTISDNTATDKGGGIFGSVLVRNSTITGNTASDGGGISGSATVRDSTISDNTAGNRGGGIFGGATVSHSTISGNSAGNGGGIFVNEYDTATVNNSTISGNSANKGGGISNRLGVVTVSHSTLFGNTADSDGGGIFNTKGKMTLTHSLLVGNRATNSGNEVYNDATGLITADAFNLFGDSSQSTQAALVNVTVGAKDSTATSDGTLPAPFAAILNPNLTDNGGPTLSHALVSGSPAIDLAPAGPVTDQRGFVRPAGGGHDAGAVEYGASAGNPAPANVRINGSDCNLIDAIIAANTDTAVGDCNAGVAGTDIITLIDDVLLTQPDHGDTGLPTIHSAITLRGAGFTIARDTYAVPFRLLAVSRGGDLSLYQVTLRDGYTTGRGGAISNYAGTVTVRSSTITGNTAGDGGGISNNGSYYYDGTVTIRNSTISGNTANDEYAGGGGIFNRGQMTVNNSTISGNTAQYGGGIYNSGVDFYNWGVLTVSNSTISGNHASREGGGIHNTARMTIERNLVVGNRATPGSNEIYGFSVNSSALNLLGDSSQSTQDALGTETVGASNLTATSDGTTPTALSAILDPHLADNGGTTLTHALVAGSPAIDAAGDSNLDVDQRGVARPQGVANDIGAFEYEFVEQTPVAGDCNADTAVNAGDLTALVLELFDDDGNLAVNAQNGTFPGSSSCDANDDTVIDAGDLSCTVLLIFNGPGACNAGSVAASDVERAVSERIYLPLVIRQ